MGGSVSSLKTPTEQEKWQGAGKSNHHIIAAQPVINNGAKGNSANPTLLKQHCLTSASIAE